MNKYLSITIFIFSFICSTTVIGFHSNFAHASTGGCSNVKISHWGKVRKSKWRARQMAKKGWHWKVRQIFGSATEKWKWANNKSMRCKRRARGWQCQARGKPCW